MTHACIRDRMLINLDQNQDIQPIQVKPQSNAFDNAGLDLLRNVIISTRDPLNKVEIKEGGTESIGVADHRVMQPGVIQTGISCY